TARTGRTALAIAATVAAALAAAAAIVVWRLRAHPSRAADQVVRHRAIAADGPAAVDHAALSPDGTRVAYTDPRGALHVADLATGDEHALPTSGAVDTVTWLPSAIGALVCGPHGAGCWLELVSPTVTVPPADLPPGAGRLPRGELLALAGDRIAVVDRDRVLVTTTPGRDLGAIRAWPDGARLEEASVSPGGHLLAVYDAVAHAIHVVDVDAALATIAGDIASDRAAVTAELAVAGQLAGVAWLGDHRLVYGVVEARARTHLYDVAIDGAGHAAAPHARATFDTPIELVGGSADGRRLAYIVRARRTEAYVAPLDGDRLGAPVRLSDDPFDDTVGCWTADGAAVILQSSRGGHPTIVAAPAGGGPATVLADGDDPSLAPDGTRILFLRQRATAGGNAWTVHAVPVGGGPTTPVAALGVEPADIGLGLQCAPGAPRCLLLDAADRLTRSRWLDPSTGDIEPIAGLPDAPQWTSTLSPTGDRVALSPDRSLVDLVRTDSGLRLPLAQEDCQLQRLAWSPDGRALYASCLEPPPGPSYLLRYRPDRPGDRAVLATTPFVFTRLAVSPDGRRLAYSITDLGGSLWTADGL
ncbi:MAG TPA: hypothetical protein VHE35_26965, partial [Kofleriaceae bacterium]|nr:hypothetical protein [Kofleriaceae bacterium]